MRAKTLDGREIELTPDVLAGLKLRLKGPVFAPGDPGYEESRTVWTGMIDRTPAVVARCLGVADVVACVQFARWEQPGADQANITWAREAWNDLKRFSSGGTYINFLTEDEGPERIQAALGKGLHRLAEVKARWDPQNVFRTNRNITPV